MELFTADGLPVGPAADFVHRPGSSPTLPLSANEGRQLVTLYRLFLRLHDADSGAGGGKSSGSGGRGRKEESTTGVGNRGVASPSSITGSSSGSTGGGGGGGGSALSLSGSLEAVLKPEGVRCVRALVGQRGLSSIAEETDFPLAGAFVGHRELDGRHGLCFMGSGAGEWAPVLSAGGPLSAVMQSGALTYPFFLLPARFFPHVSRLKGFPALSSGSAVFDRYADDGDGAEGPLPLPTVLLNSNRSAQMVDEVALRCTLCRSGAIGNSNGYNGHNNSGNNNSGGGANGHSAESQSMGAAAASGDEASATPLLRQRSDEAVRGQSWDNNLTTAAAAAAVETVSGELSSPPVVSAAAASTDMAAARVGESVDADPPLPLPLPLSLHHQSAAFFPAQLMVESAARRWFCLPAEAQVPTVGEVPGENRFTCILFGCGVVAV